MKHETEQLVFKAHLDFEHPTKCDDTLTEPYCAGQTALIMFSSFLGALRVQSKRRIKTNKTVKIKYI